MDSSQSSNRKIPAILFYSFVITFLAARGIVYFIHSNLIPLPFSFIREIYINGVHVHHFVFGIVLIIIAGFLHIINQNRTDIRKISTLFGIGLALIMDEFGMLVTLEDNYWSSRLNYGAVFVVGFLLFNICFCGKFWRSIIPSSMKKIFVASKGE